MCNALTYAYHTLHNWAIVVMLEQYLERIGDRGDTTPVYYSRLGDAYRLVDLW